jgi:hypothetical protein
MAQQDPYALAIVKPTVVEVFLAVRCHDSSLSYVSQERDHECRTPDGSEYKNQRTLVRVRGP